jgi:Flp pilus assembly protein TadG
MTHSISVSRVLRDQAGAAALEFAIIVPLLILMGLGAIEFSAAIRAQMQVDQVAHTVANLIANQSESTPISAAQMKDYQIAAQAMYNYANLGTLSISAASVNYTNLDANGNVKTGVAPAVGWDASNAAGAGFAVFPTNVGGSALNEISNNLQISDTVDNDSVIVVAAVASFKLPFLPNFFGPKFNSNLSFESVAFARPRYELQIPSSGF